MFKQPVHSIVYFIFFTGLFGKFYITQAQAQHHQICAANAQYMELIPDTVTGKTAPTYFNDLELNLEGDILAVASVDQGIWFFDVASLEPLCVLLAGTLTGNYSLDWASDNTHLIASYTNDTLIFWNPQTGFPQQLITAERGRGIRAIAWSPNARLFAFTTASYLQVRDEMTDQIVTTIQRDFTASASLAWSPDGRFLAAGYHGFSDSRRGDFIGIWETITWEQIQLLDADYFDVGEIAWSPDGRLLATGSNINHELTIWDAQAWEVEVVNVLPPPYPSLDSLVWSPDGTRLAVSGDNLLKIINPQTGEDELIIIDTGDPYLPARVSDVIWSADGTRLFSAINLPGGGRLVVWDAGTGEELRVIQRDVQ